MSSTTKTTHHERWMQDPEYRRAYFQEDIIQTVEEQLFAWMEDAGINQSDLAARLGKSRSYVSQLFSGSRNMTLRTLADICWAIGVTPEFRKKKATRRPASRARPASVMSGDTLQDGE